MRLPIAVLAAILYCGVARADGAAPGCSDAVRGWAGRCAASAGISVQPTACPPGLALFAITPPGAPAPVRVEVRADSTRVFRRVGDYALSIVDDIADYQAAPRSTRDAFEHFADCLARDPALQLDAATVQRGALGRARDAIGMIADRLGARGLWALGLALGAAALGLAWRRPRLRAAAALVIACAVGLALRRELLSLGRGDSPRALPWLVLGALAALGASLASARPRVRLRATFALAALGAATFGLRALLIAPGFFHQNGQGPVWIRRALKSMALPYGPGYWEVFGWIARDRAGAPEHAVFLLQSLLAATAPVSAWLIARAVGGRRSLAWAFAIALAVEPALGRIASSESYFSVCASLLLGAGAILAVAGLSLARWSAPLTFAALAAGLLVAQAARIHPLAWLPAALVPVVLLVGRGALARRVVRAAVAGAVIGACVALTSARALLGVLAGTLGERWLSASGPPNRHGAGMWWILLLAAASLGAAIGLAPRRGAAMVRGAVLAAVLGAVLAADRNGVSIPPVLHLAAAGLYAPALVASGAALLGAQARHARTLSMILAALAIGEAALTFRVSTAHPTDALEAEHALGWRDRVPVGAAVVYFGHIDERVLDLPLYDGRLVALTATGAAPLPTLASLASSRTLPADLYYYHSSLCSTDAGRPLCAAFERALQLEPMASESLPARPSTFFWSYDADPVPVALHRVAAGPGSPRRTR